MGDTFAPSGTLFPRITALTDGSAVDLLRLQLLNQADAFLFGDDGNPGAGQLVSDFRLIIADANGKRVFTADGLRVQVNITGGLATGKKLKTADGSVVGAVDGSIIVTFTNGEVLLQAEVAAAGTFTIGLTDVDTIGLLATDTSTQTFS